MTEGGEAMPAMRNWSVIRTRARWEKKVVELLRQKGIEAFCPLQKSKSQWSDRVKTIEKPLLKSFVFVKISEDQRTEVRLTEGVLNFVYRSGKPVVVKEKLVQGIRQFQQAYAEVVVMETGVEKVLNGSSIQTGKDKTATLWIETLNLVMVSCLVQSNDLLATTDKI